ncbi:energy transducer TonB [Hymenobacter endophyticus]|uniref:Energy transducer TonB n=1 Tax=Hymenobacter endophyticus TaxID=3076335 RepID=A0ABU3TLC7_9BACT|nr:energy transducer TonB [Hymenobacter endophyticus]MDU0372179.1 energy transducer TonB [Hymenobacter endophyticus]
MPLPLLRTTAFLALLLAAHPGTAQNSYNWWDARPPAPVTPLPRPARKPAPIAPASAITVVIDSLPLTTGKYTYVEVMPAFPGGQENMLNFLRQNLQRPRAPRQHGRVLVNLVVAATGAVTEVRVAAGHGLSPAYDAAAVECVRRLPRFMPGRREGKPVPTALTVPVIF